MRSRDGENFFILYLLRKLYVIYVIDGKAIDIVKEKIG